MRSRWIRTITPLGRGQVPANVAGGFLILKEGGLQLRVTGSSSCGVAAPSVPPDSARVNRRAATLCLAILEAPIVEDVGQQVRLVVVPIQRDIVDDGRR